MHGKARVAAYALTNILDAAFFYFLWQKGVGNRRTRRTDQIDQPIFDERHHAIWRRVSPDSDHRLGCHLFHEGREWLLPPFVGKAGCHHIEIDVLNIDIPQIGQLGEHLDDPPTIAATSVTSIA